MCKNNNINNIFQTMASGASQGFIVRPILFNIFFYNVFFFLCIMSVHNFAHENTLSSFAKIAIGLVSILELECGCPINFIRQKKFWFVSPSKYHKW